jgi:outer membrane protein insertion porin family
MIKRGTAAFVVVLALAASLPDMSTAAPAEPEHSMQQYVNGFAAITEHDENKPINTISFVTPVNLDYEDLIASVTLKPGDLLSKIKLEESLDRLRLRHVFALIEPLTKEATDGIELRFVLAPLVFVSQVEFSGNQKLDERRLQRLAAIRFDQPYSADVLDSAVQRIRSGYADRGYRQAEVTPEVQTLKAAPNLAVVRFNINEGYRATIASVRVEGIIPQEVEPAIKRLSIDWLGRGASGATFKKMQQFMLGALRREGYLQATVEVSSVIDNTLSGDVDVVFTLVPREPVTIVFVGNTVFTPLELLALLKLRTRTLPVTDGAIRLLRREIRKLYQENGYYRTKVRSKNLGERAGRKVYQVTINEGRKYRLNLVVIQGNKSLSRGKLMNVIETRPSGFWFLKRWQPGFLVKERILGDVAAIKELYESRGYFDTEASYRVDVGHNEEELNLSFLVLERPQQLINSVDVLWRTSSSSTEQTLEVPPVGDFQGIYSTLKIGSPFSSETIAKERTRLYKLIVRRGYPNAEVEVEADKTKGEVQFVITPGVKVTIGKIVLQGNAYTHDYVISRELSFSSGDLWQVSEIERSQEALYSLRSFRTVSIKPADGVIDSPVEDVAISVGERDTASVELGGSFNTEDGLRLTTELAQRNVFGNGAAVVLGVDGYFRTREHVLDAVNSRLAYTRPRLLGTKLDFSVEGFAQSSLQFVNEYSYSRVGVSTTGSYRLAENVKGSSGVIAYNENLFDVARDVIIGPNDDGTTFFSMLQTDLDYDRRDNPYNPHSGYRTVLNLRLATDALGSEANFVSITAQQSTYTPLNQNYVWANNVRLRLIEPFGDTEVVPLGQRLFLGGRNSLRGFSPNVIGPRGEELSIVGGDTSLNVSTELQYSFSENVVGLLFFDAGQAILEHEGTFTGDALTLSDLRYCPGVGMHYNTPIGPISGEVGFALDREFGERWGRIYIGIGNAF